MTELAPEVKVLVLGVYKSLRVIPRLAHTIQDAKPQLMLVLGASNALPLTIARAMVGSRCSILLREASSPSGLVKSYSIGKRLIKRLAFAFAFKRADHVIALCNSMRTELERDWHVPAEKSTLIYNAVAVRGRPKHTRQSNMPIILCVARLTHQKDIPTLLRAFAIVRSVCMTKLVIAGTGAEHSALVKLSSQLGIAGDAEFLGHVHDVESLYATASLTVLSSRYEGFPNVLVEALAQGCPVVATDCPTGPSEIITGPDIGLLANMGDPNDLAEKILCALRTRYDKARLFEHAASFSEERMSDEVQALVARMLVPAQ
jgi:glycosyltransferase involved in cell wall biosynthesis